MTKLYLIRHGQSEWNKLGRVQGQINTKLTDLGKAQAKAMGERLKNHNIDLIYSSDLSRALNTAKIIGKELGKEVTSIESLKEMKFGVWEGLTRLELKTQYQKEYGIWLTNPEDMNLEGAETLETLKKRVMEWIDPILQKHSGKNIAIVSHSVTLKVLLLGLLNIHLSHYKNLSIANVGLNIIESRDYNNVLIKLNDISHLEGLL